MRYYDAMTLARIARRGIYVVATLALVALFVPFGLTAGLVLLSLGALISVIWVLNDRFLSNGVLCSSCEYYQGPGGAMGKCRLTDNMAWAKTPACGDFVPRSPAK